MLRLILPAGSIYANKFATMPYVRQRKRVNGGRTIEPIVAQKLPTKKAPVKVLFCLVLPAGSTSANKFATMSYVRQRKRVNGGRTIEPTVAQKLPNKKHPLRCFLFGTPCGNRTHNCPLGGDCYIHLTKEAAISGYNCSFKQQ